MLDASLVLTMCALAFLWGCQVAKGEIADGNLAAEFRRIAGAEPQRFVNALQVTVETYSWKPNGLRDFVTIFKQELGLDVYASDALYVKEREQVRAILMKLYDPIELDAFLQGLEELTPLEE
jgi:hypothetical protein